MYAILIDQSSPVMRSKLEGTTGNDQVNIDQEDISLLAMIKKIMCGLEEYLQNTMAILMSEKTLHKFFQNPNGSNNDYKSQFNAYVTILEAYVGRITVPLALVDGNLRELYPSLGDPNNVLSHQREAAIEAAKDKYPACMLFVGAKMKSLGN